MKPVIKITSAIAIAAASITTITIWGIIQNKQADWWAAWGQWVGGLGSIAAAVVAVLIAVVSWEKSDNAAKEQRIYSSALQEQEQVAKFGIWVQHGGPDGLVLRGCLIWRVSCSR